MIPRVDCRFEIADLGFKKKQKIEILLWERLSRPELACPEPVEGSKGSRDLAL
jgi:hypothetical protein